MWCEFAGLGNGIEVEVGREGTGKEKNGVGHKPVLSHVEDLGADEKSHVVHADSDQHFVARAIERLVVVTIDLCVFVSN